MREKPFREIQITEIADRADVSRPAFYLHFHSKEELLLSHVDVVFEEFHAALSHELAAGHVDRQKFSIMLFEYWERHADTLKLVIQADVQHVLMTRLREYIAIVMAELAAGQPRSAGSQLRHEAVVDFMTGGAYMLLTRWIVQNQPRTAEAMGRLLYQLTRACEP